MKFKKGMKVAKVISCAGFRTVSFNNEIASVGKKSIKMKDSSLVYNLAGNEIDAAIPGFSSHIMSHEEAVQNVKCGNFSLDAGEVLPE